MLSTKRHANSDLMRLQRDSVGHHAKYANEHEREADSGECAGRDHAELWLRIGEISQEVLNRSTVRNGCVRVYAPNRALDARQQSLGIHGRGCQDIAFTKAADGVGEEDLGHGRFQQAPILEVRDHTDDLEIGVVRGLRQLIEEINFEFLPERVLTSEVSSCKSLVDNSYKA